MTQFLRSIFGSTPLWAGAFALALVGCVTPEGGAPIPVQTQAHVSAGDIVIAAPRGFCVDPKTLRDAPGGSFVLFGHCQAMARDPAQPRPSAPVLLSATLGPADDLSDNARINAIAAFFKTDIGRATLARSGRSEDVDLIEAQPGQGRLLLKIRDRSAPTSVAKAQVFWRMITVIEGRIASLSVMPLAENQVPDARQRELLAEFIARIRAAN